ncbi:MAG: CHAT domain-containing protein [Nannocystaceae bacterium]
MRHPGADPAILAEVGETLRRFLAPTGWEVHEERISAAVRHRQAVQITIRSAAAELFALPWELLTLHATGQSLGGLPGVLVRYEWPETATTPIPEGAAGSRILVAWSAAGGEVPASEHLTAIGAASTAGGVAFDPAADVLARVSPGGLAAALADAEAVGRPIAALHLLCHGGSQGNNFGLLLDGDDPGDPPALLDPARLQQLLAPYAGSLRLVVVAACDSGNQGDLGGRLGSAAQRLHRAGLADVIASRYPLSVSGSTRLTEVLYRRLLGDRASLEEAFVAARTALTSHTASLDWASVQLYARAADGAGTFPIAPPTRAPSLIPPAPSTAPTIAPPVPGSRRWPIVVAALGAIGIAIAVLVRGALGGSGEAASNDANQSNASSPTPVVIEGATAGQGASAGATDSPKDPTPEDDPKDPSPPSTTTTTTTGAGVVEPPDPTPTPTSTPTSTPKKPSVECPSGVKSYVRSLLPDGGGSVARLKINAEPDGSLTASGDGAAAKAARTRLSRGRSDRVKQQARGALPCHFNYEWAQSG